MIEIVTKQDLDRVVQHLQGQIDALKSPKQFYDGSMSSLVSVLNTRRKRVPSKGSLAAKIAKRVAGKKVGARTVGNYYKRPAPTVSYAFRKLVAAGMAERLPKGLYKIREAA